LALGAALVLGGIAALVVALGRTDHLRTALISSGVAFVGYGPLMAWYIPHRWFDYALGCGLAWLFFPTPPCGAISSSSKICNNSAADLLQIFPAVLEEALWLGLPPPEAP
jgi:hypothetical protein